MPDFIDSDKSFGIGNGLRVIHSWEAGLHMEAKSRMTLTLIGSTNEDHFRIWDTNRISTPYSSNKLNSSFKPSAVEANYSLYAVS